MDTNFHFSYVLKTQGRRNFKLSDNAVDLCAVCFQASEGTDEPWFGQNICQVILSLFFTLYTNMGVTSLYRLK